MSKSERDAETPKQAAEATGLSVATVYNAMSSDPTRRGGLPYLPSLKIGKSRRILVETRRQWLRDLEDANSAAGKGA